MHRVIHLIVPQIVPVEHKDIDRLQQYLNGLSETTRGYFGPHPFTQEALELFYNDQKNRGYMAVQKNSIIAYAIVRQGFLEHDQARLSAYGMELSTETDATFAPSVADDWQGKGIGRKMFEHIIANLTATNINRLILWGGVQTENERAVRYYQKLGFETLGYFEYRGWNTDMAFRVTNR